MKFSSNLVVALCVLHPIAAFVVQTPKAAQGSALNTWTGPTTTTEKTESYTFPSATTGVTKSDKSSYTSSSGRSTSEKFASTAGKGHMKNMWDSLTPTTVQGGSLRTWSFATSAIERVQVMLRTDGRPLHANVELWQGPDNTPVKMQVYNEDGSMRPFSAVIETPRGQNSIAIRNTGQMEFPLSAAIGVDVGGATGNGKADLGVITRKLEQSAMPKTVQGGAVHTFPFDPSVASVQVMLKTDGRPLNARLELLQGPNNNKQVIDLYVEDGLERPFFMVIETPGSGNVVRVVNTATMEFPMTVRVEPYEFERSFSERGGDSYFIMDRVL